MHENYYADARLCLRYSTHIENTSYHKIIKGLGYPGGGGGQPELDIGQSRAGFVLSNREAHSGTHRAHLCIAKAHSPTKGRAGQHCTLRIDPHSLLILVMTSLSSGCYGVTLGCAAVAAGSPDNP